jgi:DNA-binding cell septation regulator SpoVG
MNEPRFGYKNLIKTKKDGKIKAFFSLLIPTESVGTIELAGFKLIEGSKGLFVSLPSRSAKGSQPQKLVAADGSETIVGSIEGVKYYNNIRFESNDRYQDFRKAIEEDVLPLISRDLAVMA